MATDVSLQRLFAPLVSEGVQVFEQRLFVPLVADTGVFVTEQRLFVPLVAVSSESDSGQVTILW